MCGGLLPNDYGDHNGNETERVLSPKPAANSQLQPFSRPPLRSADLRLSRLDDAQKSFSSTPDYDSSWTDVSNESSNNVDAEPSKKVTMASCQSAQTGK